jgi:hypothetical protein
VGPTDLGSRYSKSISCVVAPGITGNASVLKRFGRAGQASTTSQWQDVINDVSGAWPAGDSVAAHGYDLYLVLFWLVLAKGLRRSFLLPKKQGGNCLASPPNSKK